MSRRPVERGRVGSVGRACTGQPGERASPEAAGRARRATWPRAGPRAELEWEQAAYLIQLARAGRDAEGVLHVDQLVHGQRLHQVGLGGLKEVLQPLVSRGAGPRPLQPWRSGVSAAGGWRLAAGGPARAPRLRTNALQVGHDVRGRQIVLQCASQEQEPRLGRPLRGRGGEQGGEARHWPPCRAASPRPTLLSSRALLPFRGPR